MAQGEGGSIEGKTIDQFFIEYDGRKRLVGEIWNNTFYKRIRGSEHIHQKSQSIGIDSEVFNIVLIECSNIKILDTESDTLYEVTPRMFSLQGHYLNHKPHRPQILLPLKQFKVTKKYVAGKNKRK